VGPALFFSLLVITLSFIPVFSLEAQEGRLFSPLAFTKSYAMAAAAGLSVTLVPVLMGYLIRGRIPDEHKNPLTRFLIATYRRFWRCPAIPLDDLARSGGLLVASLYPVLRLGGEFMPPLMRGPALHALRATGAVCGKAAEVLQQTDRLIRTVPEVERVFGRPVERKRRQIPRRWRCSKLPSSSSPGSVASGDDDGEADRGVGWIVKVPGLSNIWVPPIRNRIDMLATGIKSPLGIKVAGANLAETERVAQDIERVVKDIPGVTSALAERLTGGRYIDITVDRDAAARYGMNVSDVQDIVMNAIGGRTSAKPSKGYSASPSTLAIA